MRSRALTAAMVFLAGSLVGSCGIAKRAEQEAAYKKANEDMATAIAACEVRFPAPRKGQQAAWGRCMNDAERPMLAYQPYPDLLELKFANRVALLARIDRGQLTPEDAALEAAKLSSQVMAEYQRRTNSSRAVLAQETSAAAASTAASAASSAAFRQSLGVTCTKYGNSVTCL